MDDGTAADTAGLQDGDVIITFDDSMIEGGMEELIDRLAEYEPGEVVYLTILRDGKEKALRVTLGTRP